MREDDSMAEHDEQEAGEAAISVTGLVPMIPVMDVERSIEFYKLLGFAVGNRVPREGRINWAWLYSTKASDWRRGPNFMVSRSERALGPSLRDILFYLYATDLVGLRRQLVAAGQKPGAIQYPDYLPNGEFEILDPDGYCLMLAQSHSDTP